MTDADYMLRALQLARCGLGEVSPNPMVGAVIVGPGGRILGEGFHRRFGEAHAEVNAVRSVGNEDASLFGESTVYVTLEPCAHFGKTPPCADLLVEKGFRRVVIGSKDPFDSVNGRGTERLKQAGVEVLTGVCEAECQSLNARFFIAHTLRRPFVMLKWAQSLDGYMDRKRENQCDAARFSTPVGTTLVHRLRANFDAIAVGVGTFRSDSPRLDVRNWDGRSPQRFVFSAKPIAVPGFTVLSPKIAEELKRLYSQGITSLIVEGGPTLLRSFIDEGLWDLARVETANFQLGENGSAIAPSIPSQPIMNRTLGDNVIYYYSNHSLVNNYFIDNGL